MQPDDDERTRLREIEEAQAAGRHPPAGGRSDADIAGVPDVGTATVEQWHFFKDSASFP